MASTSSSAASTDGRYPGAGPPRLRLLGRVDDQPPGRLGLGDDPLGFFVGVAELRTQCGQLGIGIDVWNQAQLSLPFEKIMLAERLGFDLLGIAAAMPLASS